MHLEVSVKRYSCSSRKIPLTSAGGRLQFAEESAKRVSVWMPRPGAVAIIRRAASAPALCPAERGKPREEAQRPFPSEMIATCSGRVCAEEGTTAGGCCKTIGEVCMG